MSRPSRQPFRNDRVHVMARLCDTCIFRPGNVMDLDAGRVDSMVREACAKESTIVCHETVGGNRAVCRGFYERHQTLPLILAEKLGYITWQEAPKK